MARHTRRPLPDERLGYQPQQQTGAHRTRPFGASGAFPTTRARQSLRLLPRLDLQNVETAVVVGRIDDAVGIHEHVGRLDNARTIWTPVHQTCPRWWHPRGDLDWSIWIAHIKRTYTCVLIGCEDNVRADKRP